SRSARRASPADRWRSRRRRRPRRRSTTSTPPRAKVPQSRSLRRRARASPLGHEHGDVGHAPTGRVVPADLGGIAGRGAVADAADGDVAQPAGAGRAETIEPLGAVAEAEVVALGLVEEREDAGPDRRGDAGALDA